MEKLAMNLKKRKDGHGRKKEREESQNYEI